MAIYSIGGDAIFKWNEKMVQQQYVALFIYLSQFIQQMQLYWYPSTFFNLFLTR